MSRKSSENHRDDGAGNVGQKAAGNRIFAGKSDSFAVFQTKGNFLSSFVYGKWICKKEKLHSSSAHSI